MISLIVALLIATAPASAADRHLLYMGGGGEPQGQPATAFDQTLMGMSSYLSANPWKHSVAFNGGHPETEEKLARGFQGAASKEAFTAESFKRLIASYKNRILNGQIKPGEQLVVVLDTHGAENTGHEKSHRISVSPSKGAANLNDLAGAETLNLDALEDLAALAEQKGVKLGIIDFTCFSGNTQKLANKSTCVISATGSKHYGYTNFSNRFMEGLRPGVTLEEAFLEARRKSPGASVPMISSGVGRGVQEQLYERITPFLYYYKANTYEDRLKGYLESALDRAGSCRRENQYADLMKWLESMKGLGEFLAWDKSVDVIKLQELIAGYKTQQDRLVTQAKALGAAEYKSGQRDFEKPLEFYAEAKAGLHTGKMKLSYSSKELVQMDTAGIVKERKEALDQSRSAEDRAANEAALRAWEQVDRKKNELMAKHSELQNYQQKFQALLAGMKDSKTMAEAIGAEERKLYQALYQSAAKDSNARDVCREIVF
ncbi:MAG: hypothetical protein NDJ90_13420 [Oligoflexia bacterium]|nr:hypothetical protein [Oligoflexia bacterium]